MSADGIAARNPKVLFFLGGPGAGKGTQCSLLESRLGVRHLSAGELLRAEMANDNSSYKELIDRYIREGLIVPPEITVKLLCKAMVEDPEAKLFLIDGFPRALDNYETFQAIVGPVDRGVILLTCSEDTLRERIHGRSACSGRTDDNEESLLKRLRIFRETTAPVLDMFRAQHKVFEVEANGSIEEIYGRLAPFVQQTATQ